MLIRICLHAVIGVAIVLGGAVLHNHMLALSGLIIQSGMAYAGLAILLYSNSIFQGSLFPKSDRKVSCCGYPFHLFSSRNFVI